MRIAGTIQDSIVDGPGLRYVVFTQGCLLRCEGCHNPQTWNPDAGTEKTVADLVAEMKSNPLTDGLTISGGEPFLQAEDCAELADAARESGLNVWVYTGRTFEDLIEDTDASVRALLTLTDVLVDGPFMLSKRSLSLKWRGSENQRVIDVQKSLETGLIIIAK